MKQKNYDIHARRRTTPSPQRGGGGERVLWCHAQGEVMRRGLVVSKKSGNAAISFGLPSCSNFIAFEYEL